RKAAGARLPALPVALPRLEVDWGLGHSNNLSIFRSASRNLFAGRDLYAAQPEQHLHNAARRPAWRYGSMTSLVRPVLIGPASVRRRLEGQRTSIAAAESAVASPKYAGRSP